MARAVLLGVDGTLHGTRQRAKFFSGNADVPMMVISIGSSDFARRSWYRGFHGDARRSCDDPRARPDTRSATASASRSSAAVPGADPIGSGALAAS